MTRPMTGRMSLSEALRVLAGDPPVRFSAYDGSSAGDAGADIGLRLLSQRGLAYLLTAPGDLGMARAYVSGDLVIEGIHPGDPYPALVLLQGDTKMKRPSPAAVVELVRALGLGNLRPPEPPPHERRARWRRAIDGVRHSLGRDAAAISHHYDVSNRFYELVLGPSMTYTCAVYPKADASLEEAQAEKYDLICRKLDLKPEQRLLDVGCGWGSMVRFAAREYGVRVLGVTLSAQQAQWATAAIDRDGLGDRAEVRHQDYREVAESGFDAVSSIGLTEHIGVRQYLAYFRFLRDRLRPRGRLLNHCITRPHNRRQETGPFIDRYVFPDGELSGSGRIITAVQNAGLEVMHEENLRRHYALTLTAWCRNLVDHWDECLKEVDEGTARVWGLYMAGSRLSFERNGIQVHHVLATKTDATGHDGFALRPTW
jgi:cyclopropane-fatty-acyl-phospholipid synthase